MSNEFEPWPMLGGCMLYGRVVEVLDRGVYSSMVF